MLVVYPDVTKTAVDYLRGELAGRAETYAAGTVVAAAVPNPRPVPLVVIRRAGGTADVILDRPRVDVQVWHTSEFEAARLAQLVRGLLLAARGQVIGGVIVGRTADFLGPIPVPDPESNAARYLLTVEWTVRGTQS